jgi:hypothetical protein
VSTVVGLGWEDRKLNMGLLGPRTTLRRVDLARAVYPVRRVGVRRTPTWHLRFRLHLTNITC